MSLDIPKSAILTTSPVPTKQFLVAKSRWTKRRDAKYDIPAATCWQILRKSSKCSSISKKISQKVKKEEPIPNYLFTLSRILYTSFSPGASSGSSSGLIFLRNWFKSPSSMNSKIMQYGSSSVATAISLTTLGWSSTDMKATSWLNSSWLDSLQSFFNVLTATTLTSDGSLRSSIPTASPRIMKRYYYLLLSR